MISEAVASILLRPARGLAELYPDVILEESHEDGVEITSHPVEAGAAISDHAFVTPARLTLRAGVSDSSSRNTGSGGSRPSREFYERLLELMRKREPFDIITGKRLYRNMLVARLSTVTEAATENALVFSAECQEVIIVNTHVSSVPPSRLHTRPGSTGATADKGQKQLRQVENRSLLDSLLG